VTPPNQIPLRVRGRGGKGGGGYPRDGSGADEQVEVRHTHHDLQRRAPEQVGAVRDELVDALDIDLHHVDNRACRILVLLPRRVAARFEVNLLHDL